MRTKLAGVLVSTVLGVAALVVFKQNIHAQEDQGPTDGAHNTPQAPTALTERGQYIVHHVAMCIQCHTPRSEDGVLDEQQLLEGAPMPVSSPIPRLQWAFQAPKIAGLPGGWTEADMLKFLRTGESPTGHQPQPPMPPFRLNEEDARSVAAYLQSLE